MLGDGDAGGKESADIAKSQHGTRIQTIALGTSVSQDAKDTLQYIAGVTPGNPEDEGDYIQTTDASELNGIFKGFTSSIQQSQFGGIRMIYSTTSDNLIYDNYLDNTNNVYINSAGSNTWNVTKQTGPNILGVEGTSVSGNYYATPDDRGFSQTCDDNDNNLFSDNGIEHTKNNSDQNALVRPPVSVLDITATNPSGTKIKLVIDTDQQLSSLTVELTNQKTISLSLNDFTVTNNNGIFTYTYSSSKKPGDYTAKVKTAVGDSTSDGSNNESDTFTIEFGLEGEGTISNPYKVTGISELQSIKYKLNANYTLVSDIDASSTADWNGDTGFNPIGKPTNQFNGTFEGNGYSISNLKINRINEDHIGLFGYIGSNGTVSDIKLENTTVNGSNYVGAVAGICEGKLISTHMSGNVNGGNVVGGIIGWNSNGTLKNSYATGEVKGDAFIGGLVGQNSANNIYYGPMKSKISESRVIDSHATGNVSGQWVIVGGLVGVNIGVVNKSFATGDVNGNEYVGGLVGAHVSNPDYQSKIYASNASGNVKGVQIVGGLIGSNGVRGNGYLGGLIKDSSASGTVTVSTGTRGTNIGGLVGQCIYGKVETSKATGNVLADSAKNVGGLVGYNNGAVYVGTDYEGMFPSIILESYATGSIKGSQNVGGLIGTNYNYNVTDTYAIGDVEGTTIIGGLIGYNNGPKATVNHSYAAGEVSGADDSQIGGLIGTNQNDAKVTDAYWDVDTTGQLTSAGLPESNGLNTTEMKGDVVTYNMEFNFENTWNVITNSEKSYPYLQSNHQVPAPGLISTSSSKNTEQRKDDSSVSVNVGQSIPDENVRSTGSKQKIVSAGQTTEYDFDESSSSVKGISFESKKTIGRVVAKVETLDTLPDDVESPTKHDESDTSDGTEQSKTQTYSTMSITVGSVGTVSDDNSDNLLIEFEVTREWVEENNIDVDTIRMARYHNGEWHDLPTNKVAEDEKLLHFTAMTPGFSIFTVVGDEIETVEEEQTETEPETDTEQTETETKSTPGFSSLLALGVLGVVYMVLRRRN